MRQGDTRLCVFRAYAIPSRQAVPVREGDTRLCVFRAYAIPSRQVVPVRDVRLSRSVRGFRKGLTPWTAGLRSTARSSSPAGENGSPPLLARRCQGSEAQSMDGPFTLSAAAALDVDEIVEYVLEQSGPARAGRVADQLRHAFLHLSAHPRTGHVRADLTNAPVRLWPVWRYLVVYRPDARPLAMVRVLHGARDLAGLLKQD